VGLAEDPDVLAKRFTTEEMARNLALIAARFGMPIYDEVPERMFTSFPACRAVVATRLNQPELSRPLLRELRKRCFSKQPIDEPEVIESAAESVGLDPVALVSWLADDASGQAFQADMDAARDPSPAALAVKRKLAQWEGGWRYTCPSYVFTLADSELTAPGFQPYETYETAIANLAPELEQRPPAESVTEALEWAEGTGAGSLATVEVAALMGKEPSGAGWDLEAVIGDLEAAGAVEQRVGASAFWRLERK
ncbi:MAG: DsbA family protein, partial [bacterium]